MNIDFSVKQYETIIRAVGKGQPLFVDEDVLKLVKWMREQIINAELVELILNGEVAVDTTGEEFVFERIKK